MPPDGRGCVGMGSEIGDLDVFSGRRDAVVRRDAAAIGKIRDPPVAPQRHDGDRVFPELRDACGEAREHIDRNRVDGAGRKGVHRAPDAVARHDARVALPSVGVAGRPDENRLISGSRLRHRGDHLPEVGAEIGFAVVVDDALVADAQVQDIHALPAVAPREDPVEPRRPRGVGACRVREREGVVSVVRAFYGNGEHGDVGAPGDALRAGGDRVLPDSGGDARDGRAVGKLRAPLIRGASQEHLVHRFSREHRVRRVDAAVDEADGHAGARAGAFALEQVDVGVGPVRADGPQAPLVPEGRLEAVFQGEPPRPAVEIPDGGAGPVVERNAFLRRRMLGLGWRLRWLFRLLGGLLRLPGFGHHGGYHSRTSAPAAAVREDEHRAKKDGANRGPVQRERSAGAAPALEPAAHPGPVRGLVPPGGHHAGIRSTQPLPSVVVAVDCMPWFYSARISRASIAEISIPNARCPGVNHGKAAGKFNMRLALSAWNGCGKIGYFTVSARMKLAEGRGSPGADRSRPEAMFPGPYRGRRSSSNTRTTRGEAPAAATLRITCTRSTVISLANTAAGSSTVPND